MKKLNNGNYKVKEILRTTLTSGPIKNMNDLDKQKEKRIKDVKIRMKESLWNSLHGYAAATGMSISGYVNFILNTSVQKKEISFKEVLSKPEKKEVEKRVFFTKSEVELLEKYAENNSWSLPKEIRYRIISTLSRKLNDEELKAMYCVRSSINVLSANLNFLIRNNQILSEDSISICTELLSLIREVKDKINYLEKYTYSNFKLQEKEAEKNVL